ncbi:hypothetical protein [Shewanella donghaensis]|uniref:hypothetical protein n=1 Tax=Shewanella donghaensis TaxID=238836 RepID=UPI001182FABB|nr:hypothetical protein [Shewanella donghaensis]
MTNPTDQQRVTKDIVTKLKEFKKPSQPPLSKDKFESEIKLLVTEMLNLSKNREHPQVLELLDKPNNSVSNRYRHLSSTYNFARNRYETICDETNTIERSETRAHRRNLFYRTLTTIFVGLAIMSIYAVAHYLEIPMPLMRLPIPS